LGPKVGLYFWVRVGVMILALVGILTLMRKMNAPSVAQSVDLCPSRVASLSVIGRFAILQDGKQWYRTGDGGERVQLDSTAVEEWLKSGCTVTASFEGANSDAKPLLTLAYASGLPATLMVNEDGVFTLNQSHFRSLQLSQAITALEHLPTANKTGDNTKQ
jgi:hypothetical protein